MPATGYTDVFAMDLAAAQSATAQSKQMGSHNVVLVKPGTDPSILPSTPTNQNTVRQNAFKQGRGGKERTTKSFKPTTKTLED